VDSSRTISGNVVPDDLLAAIMQTAWSGIVQLDGRHCIARITTSAARMLGYDEYDITGSPFDRFVHERNQADPFNTPAHAQPFSMLLRTAGGETLEMRTRSTPLGHGGECGWVLTFASARSEEIEQLKNELVSTVSHELKTPLAAIKAYAVTLKQNPNLAEAQKSEFLGIVEQQADRLSRLVDEMLLVARVESGYMLRQRIWTPLDRLLDEALQGVSRDPGVHPVERRGTGVGISGDPERLRDIFRNLLENAVKYSPSGGPIVIDAQDDGKHVTVSVSDSGIGIKEEDLPYVFDRFYRAVDDRDDAAGGTGLGLYIVEALVRAHGGTISAQSSPGEGSSFTLRFPVK
jgi:two-component system phosphate regulon sensor histidine kinase PhoR